MAVCEMKRNVAFTMKAVLDIKMYFYDLFLICYRSVEQVFLVERNSIDAADNLKIRQYFTIANHAH